MIYTAYSYVEIKVQLTKRDVVHRHTSLRNHNVLQDIVNGITLASHRNYDIFQNIIDDIAAAGCAQDRRDIIKWLANDLPDPSAEHNIARKKF